MAKHYAWSNFPTEVDDYGMTRKVIKTGEEVTQQKLGVTKEEWEAYIENGTVSEEPYPDIPDHMSPAEYQRANVALEANEQDLAELRLQTENPTPTTQPLVTPKPEGESKGNA